MDIDEATLLEKLVDGPRDSVTHAEDRAKRVCPHTKVSLFTQEFERMALLLHRVRGRVGCSNKLNFIGAQLDRLTRSRRLDKLSFNGYTGTCTNIGRDTAIHNNL